MNILMSLLSNNGYIIVNKEIIKKLGLHEAIILGELCSEYCYWENNNKLDNGYFYSTRENIAFNTGLTSYQQRQLLANLEKMGIVLVKSKGMPLQKWYSLNLNSLFELLKDETDFITSREETSQQEVKKLNNKQLNNLITSCKNNEQQEVKKLNINNNNNNNINNNNNNNINNNNKDDKKVKIKDNVFITQEQYGELVIKYGQTRIDDVITRLDLYKKSTGKKYNDDYATLLLWINSDIEKEKRISKKRDSQDGVWLQNMKEKYGEDLEGIYANPSI